MVPTRRVATIVVSSFLFIGGLALMICSLSGFGNGSSAMEISTSSLSSQEGNTTTHSPTHRKLLLGENEVAQPDRIRGDKCTMSDILVHQGPTGPLPSGIPQYTVEITNVCVSGSDISKIHLSCGWFSSANLINPKVFKRLRYGDCLVNDGKPLAVGRTVFFQYSNTFPYPLKVSSVFC